MKVITDTPDRLVLAATPSSLSTGLVCLAVGLGLLAAFLSLGVFLFLGAAVLSLSLGAIMIERRTIVFDLRTRLVKWRHKNMLGTETGDLPLGDFLRADLKPGPDTGHGRACKPVLVFRGDIIFPLAPMTIGETEDQKRLVEAINDWHGEHRQPHRKTG